MNVSKCPKCSKGVFQIESITPVGSNSDILCVICHNCNTIVGTIDHLYEDECQKETDLQLKVINKKLDTINHNIGQMMNGIKLIYGKIEKSQKPEIVD